MCATRPRGRRGCMNRVTSQEQAQALGRRSWRSRATPSGLERRRPPRGPCARRKDQGPTRQARRLQRCPEPFPPSGRPIKLLRRTMQEAGVRPVARELRHLAALLSHRWEHTAGSVLPERMKCPTWGWGKLSVIYLQRLLWWLRETSILSTRQRNFSGIPPSWHRVTKP